MTTKSSPATVSGRPSLRHRYGFALGLLLAPACLGQAILPDAPIPSAPTPAYNFPTRTQRVHAYLYDLAGPGAFLAPVGAAIADQTHPLKVDYPGDGDTAPGLHPAHGTVPEWGEGFDGYAKRYADRFGQGLINTTSRYALAELLHEDVTYHRCTCTGAAPRALHALSQVFLAHTSAGRAIPSIPAIVSPYIASEVAVAAWYPARYNTSDALRISIPIFAGALPRDLLAEFKRGCPR